MAFERGPTDVSAADGSRMGVCVAKPGFWSANAGMGPGLARGFSVRSGDRPQWADDWPDEGHPRGSKTIESFAGCKEFTLGLPANVIPGGCGDGARESDTY